METLSQPNINIKNNIPMIYLLFLPVLIYLFYNFCLCGYKRDANQTNIMKKSTSLLQNHLEKTRINNKGVHCGGGSHAIFSKHLFFA